jgi:hypothetical protein
MLKAVSSITNAIGALNFKGTWDANANSPALASSVGTKGDYYVVGTAGSTNLNGISNWGVGDLATFNGSVWQRVEGGADLNGVNLSVSGTSTLSGLTASTALALNASKEVVSVTNTGTDNNVLATSPSIATPTLTGDVQMSTGNLVVGTSGKGIDFSATSHPAGMTSELLNDYEEGTWTPTITLNAGTLSGSVTSGTYTKIGRQVTVLFYLEVGVSAAASINGLSGLPFTVASGNQQAVGAIRETGVTGNMWEIITNASNTTGTIRRYDNDAALTTGFKLVGSVSYFV